MLTLSEANKYSAVFRFESSNVILYLGFWGGVENAAKDACRRMIA
jgi:hypothetical protein